MGVDLGGTNVRAAAFGMDGGRIGPTESAGSRAEMGLGQTADAIAEAVLAAAKGGSPKTVAVAVPGHIDDEAGLVRWAPNFGVWENGVFHCWREVPLKEALRTRLGCAVVLGNDANLAALGEYRFGSGRNTASCLVLLTVGTGIGGGVVMRPQAVQGKAEGPLLLVGGNKGGAELGHMVVREGGLDCTAGSYGALEAYCQRDSIVRRAQHRLARGRASLLNETCPDLGSLTPRHLTDAADRGDDVSIEVFAEVGDVLGVGIGNCINIFAPQVVAVGGQIAKAGRWLLEPAIRSARNVAIPSLMEDASIVQAEQIDEAGVLGAAAIALEGA